MKRGSEGCLNLADQGCFFPLLRRRVSGKSRPRRINGDDENDDVEVSQNIVTTPPKEQSESEAHNKPKAPKRFNFREVSTISSDSGSARLTLARLIAVLRDAYVCTMMSLGTKGSLGAVTMGGNINLPSEVPATQTKPSVMSSS